MRPIHIKHVLFTLLAFAAMSSITFAQHKGCCEAPKKETKKMSCSMNMSEMKTDSTAMSDTTAINVENFDKNNDGIVFQDQMDWDVISDVPGNCPKCGMKLKEVSVAQAKKNLVDNNFKVSN
ncbi:MAG: hypothetical protein HYV28_20400 [Ignavibacteriales bacterium]|nr:hypothetical protein [Ignavibacteriales bacterium]